MPGVMCNSDAGARNLKGYVAVSVDETFCPPGRMNTLFDAVPVLALGSSSVPTFDVAPLSATVDAMVPFSTPCFISSSFTPMSNIFRSLPSLSPFSSSLFIDALVAASTVFAIDLISPGTGGIYLYSVSLVALSANLFALARWYLSI